MLKSWISCGQSVPIGLKWRSNSIFICSTVGVGAFTDLFLYALIVPVLPFMLEDRVHLPESEIQNTISTLLAIYAGASCLASPIAGVLADRLASSRQVPFLLGLVLLLLATVLLAVGNNVPLLAIARLLQGASGGVVWTIGLAILIETVGQENLGKTMGTIFSFITVGSLFGPIIGGALYSRTGYAGVFGVGIAVIIVDFVLRLLMIEKKVATKYMSTEQLNSTSSNPDATPTESSPLLPNTPLSDNLSSYRLAPSKYRITTAFPILLTCADVGLLTSFFIGFIQALLLGAFDATVPLVASSRYGFDSLKAGLLFLPLGGADFFFGPIFGWCVDRWGARLMSMIGFLWLVPALVLLRLPEEHAISEHLKVGHEIALYACLLAFNGIGLAIINSTSIVEAGNIVEKYWRANTDLFSQAPYAQLYGINSMIWSCGLTVGPLAAGSLRGKIGYGNMNAVLGALCGVTALLAALFVGRKRVKADGDSHTRA
ncbi:MFS general substrate transporter [Lentithecium fluviatile CBS 122367]|uniref:MFS general substrate transporter n=1 Tax=Lentithecium fluviatile CBS 122367 TaxID=1168545 RepID=A0A6G1IW68_9PLEO|nr:MFS general substrate transporter [Lentithecium fluviatile CBS 122367]